jgi:uncharacterized repeat protein (TIGR03803 family)
MAFVVASSLAAPHAQAQTFTVLYQFLGEPDGMNPKAPPVRDAAGNLYGSTSLGGTDNLGTLFKITSTGAETILHTFSGTDGSFPNGPFVRDSAGNFYGTSQNGGTSGLGTVFKITKAGAYTVLYSFGAQPDGANPYGDLTMDSSGNLYGTTMLGGSGSCTEINGNTTGCGTVFKLSSSGVETVLYSFAGGTDGQFPQSSVVRDAAGNLYGTTLEGGSPNCQNGCGTIFKLTPSGVETTLYGFLGNPNDGASPNGVVLTGGSLYGTTLVGGSLDLGTAFNVSLSGTETLLHNFGAVANDGTHPVGRLTPDGQGNFYGMTQNGGGPGCFAGGCGTIFKLTQAGDEQILHIFSPDSRGCLPFGGLTRDSAGSLYGSAALCGKNSQGTIFKFTP